MISLPIFLTRENKYVVGAVAFTVAAALYLFSNHVHFFEPRMLPMTWLDEAIPFIPQTVWIYTSEYFFFISIYLICKDMANANKYLYSFMALQTVSVAIFLLWPTTFPRDQYPLVAESMDPLTYGLFSALRATDTPANCCPSLHVSSVFLSSFIFLDDQRKKFPFFFIWGTLIALSTLPTKQHYIVDVVAGFLMAVVFYWAFHRAIRYRPMGGAIRSGQGAFQANR